MAIFQSTAVTPGFAMTTTPGPVTAAAAAVAATPAAVSAIRHSSECVSGGVHPPAKDSMDAFVREVKGRIR